EPRKTTSMPVRAFFRSRHSEQGNARLPQCGDAIFRARADRGIAPLPTSRLLARLISEVPRGLRPQRPRRRAWQLELPKLRGRCTARARLPAREYERACRRGGGFPTGLQTPGAEELRRQAGNSCPIRLRLFGGK